MSEDVNANKEGQINDNENENEQQKSKNQSQILNKNDNQDQISQNQKDSQIKQMSLQQSQQQQEEIAGKNQQENDNKEQSPFALQQSQQQEKQNRYDETKYMKDENIDDVEKLFETQSNPSNRSQTKIVQQEKFLLADQQNSHFLNNNNNNNINNLNNNENIHDFYQKRKERQQAEKDGEILANRIALLKQEEIRTLKKIEETRKKALEVYYLKLKNESRQKKKKELKQNKTLYQSNLNKRQLVSNQSQQQNRPRRKSHCKLEDEKVVISKQEFSEQKKGNFQTIKQQSKENEDRIKRNKEQYLENAIKKKVQITQSIGLGKQRVQEFYEFKKYLIRQEIDEKLRQEELQKTNKLNEIKRMEDYEIELIQRLKSTQTMQQNAYEELENALMMNAQDFAGKYLNQEDEKQQQNLDQSNQSRLQASKSQPDLREQNEKFLIDQEQNDYNQGTQTVQVEQ